MWTSKRILLLASGFGLFCVLFFVYTLFLGNIDGIMPLPQEYWPSDIVVDPGREPRPENEAVKKLKIAFGPDSKEIKERSIKLSIPARGMVLATNEVNILHDGRVQIRPFSVALFGKEKGNGSLPEINTVQASEAFLTFDSPIRNQFEMTNRKIIGGELCNNVIIINNRGTSQKSDDIALEIRKGPVFYDEKLQKIWTEDWIELQDFSSKPNPTKINAKGMEVYLVKEATEPKQDKVKAKGPRQGGGDAIAGVERVVLQSFVDMHLWVDAHNGFLGSPEKKKESPGRPAPLAAKPPAEAEKAQIVIQTSGPFVYHLQKDLAIFDSPPVQEQAKTATAHTDKIQVAEKVKHGDYHQVCVTRDHSEGTVRWFDHIVCDHLELQFRPKPRAEGPGENRPVSTADKTNDREIDTALATSRLGHEVVLVLDQEGIEANGNKLFYQAGKGKQGAKTTLQGAPLEANNKEGHKITAREMILISSNADGEGQQVEATGPGDIYLFDKTKKENVENQYPCHARWKDKMIVTKDKIGDKVYDLLTLNTDAAFLDDEHKQELVGQRLQVWLEPGGRAEAAPAPAPADQQSSGLLSRQRPYKVEAQGQVRVDSPELRVRDCQNLIIIFLDAPPVLPDMLPGTTPGKGANTQLTLKPPPPGDTLPGPAVAGQPPGPVGRVLELPAPPPGQLAQTDGKPKAKEEPRPMDLSARTVRATVRRSVDKNELQTVYSEGDVVVHQEGSSPKDKGVHITGEMLKLDREPAGDKLQVFAGQKLAELQLGELYLIGPKVIIDQRDNTANIEGAGAMNMPSNTAMEGGKPAKEGARMTVTWTQQMFFNGRDADFQGKVVAYQLQEGVRDQARLQCNTMQVTLDKNVSFKEGQKAGQSAKVEKLVCDKQVIAVNITFDEQGKGKKMLQYHRMENKEMTIDNQQGPINASGPGRVSILQYGAPDALGPPTPATPGKPAATNPKVNEVPQLTRVHFENSMWSEQKNNARITKFFGNVRVLHLPTEDVEVKVDEDQLPKHSFLMNSDYLEVLNRSGEDTSKGQLMEAKVNVTFRTPEFFGRADVLIYNENAETVIFEGTVGNPARIWQFRAQGADPKVISASRILYNRKTGQFQIDRGTQIKS